MMSFQLACLPDEPFDGLGFLESIDIAISSRSLAFKLGCHCGHCAFLEGLERGGKPHCLTVCKSLIQDEVRALLAPGDFHSLLDYLRKRMRNVLVVPV